MAIIDTYSLLNNKEDISILENIKIESLNEEHLGIKYNDLIFKTQDQYLYFPIHHCSSKTIDLWRKIFLLPNTWLDKKILEWNPEYIYFIPDFVKEVSRKERLKQAVGLNFKVFMADSLK